VNETPNERYGPYDDQPYPGDKIKVTLLVVALLGLFVLFLMSCG
jgi:hypothetical protein